MESELSKFSRAEFLPLACKSMKAGSTVLVCLWKAKTRLLDLSHIGQQHRVYPEQEQA